MGNNFLTPKVEFTKDSERKQQIKKKALRYSEPCIKDKISDIQSKNPQILSVARNSYNPSNMDHPQINTIDKIFNSKNSNNETKKVNALSNLMEQIFIDNEEKKNNLFKKNSRNIFINLNNKFTKIHKNISKSVQVIRKKSQDNYIIFYSTLKRFSKSVEEKRLNKLFFLEEFFDCDCCSQYDINYTTNEYELQLVKKGEDIRKSYITKLLYNKVWEPINKPKQHNSLIIFDWDDTLLCTTHLTPNGYYNNNIQYTDKDYEKLAKLEQNVYKLIKLAISKGDTYIITNAAPGWVEYSTNKFYPKVTELLKSVKIVSARGKYESEFPNDSRMWKIQAFLEMQKNFNQNLVTNIICLGDSIIEIEAAQIIAAKFSQAYIKTIKFKEGPKPEELNKQLLLVIDQFNTIHSSVKNLTIRVEKKSKTEK